MQKASIIIIIGALLLGGLFVLPLWNITLGAPQYPDPLALDIYISGLKGKTEFDIQNIDGLNHYIGMKTLPKPGQMWEFDNFPIIIGGLMALGFIIGILGFMRKIKPVWFLIWFVLMAIFCIFGIYDFYIWLNDYGSNLDPHAILKIKDEAGNPLSYSPPIFGHKKILNFDVYSYPQIGGLFLALGTILGLVAYLVGSRETTVQK